VILSCPTNEISIRLLFNLLICGSTNILVSIYTCLPKNIILFTPLFLYFASEVFSNLCKSKCVTAFPRDSFPVCTMKDIKHNNCNYIVLHSKYYCGSKNMASVFSFLPNSLLKFTALLQYITFEVLSMLYKSKCVSTMSRNSFLICTMKDINHNACICIVL